MNKHTMHSHLEKLRQVASNLKVELELLKKEPRYTSNHGSSYSARSWRDEDASRVRTWNDKTRTWEWDPITGEYKEEESLEEIHGAYTKDSDLLSEEEWVKATSLKEASMKEEVDAHILEVDKELEVKIYTQGKQEKQENVSKEGNSSYWRKKYEQANDREEYFKAHYKEVLELLDLLTIPAAWIQESNKDGVDGCYCMYCNAPTVTWEVAAMDFPHEPSCPWKIAESYQANAI